MFHLLGGRLSSVFICLLARHEQSLAFLVKTLACKVGTVIASDYVGMLRERNEITGARRPVCPAGSCGRNPGPAAKPEGHRRLRQAPSLVVPQEACRTSTPAHAGAAGVAMATGNEAD